MDLNEILVFARVVQAGSFIGAARALEMPKSTVSRKVSELEERLGARLLHRTTRKLRLTDVGHAFYQHAERMVGEAEEAVLVVGRMQEMPRGRLRVTAPLSFGYLSSIVASFLQRYPEVALELVCTDRVVDLLHEGFDVAVRAGHLTDSTLIARNLGVLRSYLVAAPAFLQQSGAPTSPEELERLDCVVFGAAAERARWQLYADLRAVTVDVKARLVVNDFDFVEQAAFSGLGVAMIPAFRCVEALRSQRLLRVLPAWSSPEIPVHAVYPSARHLSPKVKAFVEHLRESMTPPPWEVGSDP